MRNRLQWRFQRPSLVLYGTPYGNSTPPTQPQIDEAMTGTCTPIEAGASKGRSRIANGAVLPSEVDGRSAWARLMRDVHGALMDHVGGADRASEPQRLTSRRIATLEAQLVAMETAFALAHEKGEQPSAADLDLYSRLTNTQRRELEALGFDRKPRDLVPNLDDYIAGSGKREAA